MPCYFPLKVLPQQQLGVSPGNQAACEFGTENWAGPDLIPSKGLGGSSQACCSLCSICPTSGPECRGRWVPATNWTLTSVDLRKQNSQIKWSPISNALQIFLCSSNGPKSGCFYSLTIAEMVMKPHICLTKYQMAFWYQRLVAPSRALHQTSTSWGCISRRAVWGGNTHKSASGPHRLAHKHVCIWYSYWTEYCPGGPHFTKKETQCPLPFKWPTNKWQSQDPSQFPNFR